MKQTILILTLLFTYGSYAQKTEKKLKTSTTFLSVKGVCKMCKNRIEKTALKNKGVKYASWNLQSKELHLIYNPNKANKSDISKSILSIGHDVDTLKATETAYQKLHACCKYRADSTH